MALKTDYKDDVLNTSVNTARTFNLRDSEGNLLYSNVQIEETTVFDVVGDEFGKDDVNEQNETINQISDFLTEIKGWTLVGSATGTNEINLPSDYNELMVDVSVGSSSVHIINRIPKILLDSSFKKYMIGGGYWVQQYGMGVRCQISLTKIKVDYAWNDGSEITNSVPISVYYH